MTLENAHETVPFYKEICAHTLTEEAKQDDLQKAIEMCDTEEIIVPAGFGNIFPVRMLVHTPKSLKGKKNLVPYFCMHQGGAIGGSPDLNKPFACHYAVTLQCVAFNPTYMLAGTAYGETPEIQMKVPDGQGGETEMKLPAYPGRQATGDEMANGIIATIRYVHENCEKWGVDAKKVVVEGISGGGYAVAAMCGRLAVLGESHLVKLAISNCGVTPGFFLPPIKKKLAPCVEMAFYDGPYIVKAYSTDFDKQWKEKDPVVFPHEASEEILRRWPSTIVISAEFDTYEPAVRDHFNPRLKKAGRLLESICYPGGMHGFMMNGKYERTSAYWADMKQIFKEYVN